MPDPFPVPELQDGEYPFIDGRYPLSELSMIEVPEGIRDLLISQARKNGIGIARDSPVEIRCISDQFGDATFLIYWPHGHAMHMLAPSRFRRGNA